MVKRALVETRLSEAIKDDLLGKSWAQALERFRKRTAELQAKKARAQRPGKARVQLEQVERAIGNLVEAIKAGAYSPSLQAELARLEAEKERLLALSQAEGVKPQAVARLVPRVDDVLRRLVHELELVMSQDPERARYLLRALLDEVSLRPRKGYLVAKMQGHYTGLLELSGVGDNHGTEERT